MRAEEIEAIEKAIAIISSGDVAGNSEKHLPQFVQTGSALAQLRAADRGNQDRVAAYLQHQGEMLGSPVLSTLAVRVANDPFIKVKKMIKDLIVRLMEEANEEAEHKGFCDTELASNEQTRKEKTSMAESLHAQVDELEAGIQKRTEELAALAKQIAELDAAMNKATALRTEEKAKNAETIQDAKDAQQAVTNALSVLKDFYEKAGDATSFVQQKPEIFDEPYKGMQAENGGVIGMLEVILSDFARLQSDTESSEKSSQESYDELMTLSEVDKEKKA